MIRLAKPKFAILVIVALATANTLIGQKKRNIDSLLQLYRELPDDTLKVGILGDLSYAYMHNNVALAKKYAYERLSLAKKTNYKIGIAHAHYGLGNFYYNLQRMDSAKVFLKEALSRYTDLQFERGIFMSNHMRGTIANSLGSYDNALELFSECIENRIEVGDSIRLAATYIHRSGVHENKGNHRIAYSDILSALDIYDKIDQPLWKADALYQLGVLDGIFKNYDKAVEYSLQAFKIYEEYNDKKFMGTTANGIGAYYIEMGEFEKAKTYLNKSIALCNEIKLPAYEGAARRNLGIAYVKQKQYNEGIGHLLQALEINRKADIPVQLLGSLEALGNAYNEINQPRKALLYFDEAVSLQETKALSGDAATIYEGKAKSLELLKRHKEALATYERFKVLNDSVFNSEKANQIEELRTIYDTEKKEQQIVLQKKEIESLEQKAEISNLQRILMAAGLLLSLIGLYALRQKMKRNRLQREKIAAELEFRKKELTTHALHLAKKNEVLENVKQKAKELKLSENGRGYQQLIQTINFDQQDDKNWENFTQYFEQVHKNFASNVKQRYPDVTKNELRFMALLKMNMSSKEIATILNISTDGIKKARQRLRKKMGLTSKESLENTVLEI